MTANIVVVGTGYWGKNHVRNYHELGSLYGVCDQDPETLNSFASEYNTKALSFDESLSSEAVEGIVIATPAHLHFEQASQALHSGKNVFVEKPLSLTSHEARQLCELAKEKKCILMVGHILQYHPAFKKLKELVVSGDLGTIKMVTSNRMSFGKFRFEEDVWWSFAPHDISMVMALIGEEPCKIQTSKDALIMNDLADHASAVLHFPGGVVAKINASWLSPFKEHKMVVIGDKAMAVFDDTQSLEQKLLIQQYELDGDVPVKTNSHYVALEPAEPLKSECQHFIDCIKSGSTPKTDGAEGYRVLKALEEESGPKNETYLAS